MFLPTSIHWHGLYQKGSSWSDGTAFVSQCPIVPGASCLYNLIVPSHASADNSFTYKFNAQGQAGTFGTFPVFFDPNAETDHDAQVPQSL
jgi:FtsP/CotA-like multicopper oxidase with cupredoxin domain